MTTPSAQCLYMASVSSGARCSRCFNEAGFSLSVIGVQILAIGVAFTWACGLGLIVFKLIAATIGRRVTEEELQGLDLSEHRAEAWPDASWRSHKQCSPHWKPGACKSAVRTTFLKETGA